MQAKYIPYGSASTWQGMGNANDYIIIGGVIYDIGGFNTQDWRAYH